MSFPLSPANNQVTLENGIAYTYNASRDAWFRTPATALASLTSNTFTVLNSIIFSDGTSQTTAANPTDAYARTTANTATNNITILQGVDTAQNTRMSIIEGVDTTQNTNITIATNAATGAFAQANATAGGLTTANSRIDIVEGVDTTQNTRMSIIEGVNTTQNTNITAADTKAQAAFNRANDAFALANTANTIASSGGGGASGGFVNLNMPGTLNVPFTGTSRYYPTTSITLGTVYANLSASPSANLQFVILKNGANIGNSFIITTSSPVMTPVALSGVSLTTNDYLTLNLLGSEITAADLWVRISYS